MLRSLALLAVLPTVQPTMAADLSVTLAGIRNDSGYVMAAIFDSPRGFPNEAGAVAQVKMKARPGQVGFVITGLPPGHYAVSAFHDENGNGKLDTNLLGVPTEGYGFSNDARGRFGPPAFDAAAMTLDGTGWTITVTLRY